MTAKKVYCETCKNYRVESGGAIFCDNERHHSYIDSPLRRMRESSPFVLNSKNNCKYFEQCETKEQAKIVPVVEHKNFFDKFMGIFK